MEFKINTIHFRADRKLVQFIRDKVKKLELIYDKIISSEVYLRLDKSSNKENKIAEVKLVIPGNKFFAKKQCKSFEEAADSAVQALKNRVSKSKNKKI